MFLQREWSSLSQEEKDKYGYEHKNMNLLRDLVGKVDRRIEDNQRKVDQEQELAPEFAKQVNNHKQLDKAVL